MASITFFGYQTVGPLSDQNQRTLQARKDDRGFTLVELLIVSVLIPIIVGAISLALLATFRVQTGITDRLSSTGDSQAVSAAFFPDVQRSTYITTNSSPSVQCGADPPTLSLEWILPTQFATIVSYSVVPNGIMVAGIPQYALVRNECTNVQPSTGFPNGTAPPVIDTPTSSIAVSQNVAGPLSSWSVGGPLTATVTCDATSPTCASLAASGWNSTAGVSAVQFVIDESLSSNPLNNPGNAYSYSLAAAPRSWSSGGGVTGSISPLELVNQSILNGCSSGALVNVNGAMLLQPSGTVSAKKDTINTAAVYYTGTAPSPTTAFVGASASPPLPFTQLVDGYKDPFGGIAAPNPLTLPARTTLGLPGVYSSSINVTSMVALSPGIYYFTNSASLSVQGNGSGLTGSGVLLYFEPDASFTVGANAAVNLHPATSGTYDGLTVWQGGGGSGQISWKGNAQDSHLNGVIYAPNSTVFVDGSDNVFASNIITNQLNCNGGGNTGSINIGYTQRPSTTETLNFTKKPPTGGVAVSSTFTVHANSSNPSGNPIIFSIDPTSTSKCYITGGNVVSFSSTGTCVVDANQYGTGIYWAAIEVQLPIKVK